MYTTNIDYVVKTSWGYHDGTKRGGFTYHVHYKPSESRPCRRGRERTFSDRDNLPMTVVNFIEFADDVKTIYVPESDSWQYHGLKHETYRLERRPNK